MGPIHRLIFIFQKRFDDKLSQIKKGPKPVSEGNLYPLVGFYFYWKRSTFIAKGKNEKVMALHPGGRSHRTELEGH